jgi:Cyclo-malto-dextrinase C-terminal domain
VDTARFSEMIGAATTATDVITQQRHALAQGLAVSARSATILEIN